MGTHMKTTIEISDPLLTSAKALARREGTTVRSLVEQGLRHVVDEARSKKRGKRFVLRDASVGGRGLTKAAGELRWQDLLDLVNGPR